MEELTKDSFFNGALMVRQPKNGYRFSIDAILLAHYAGLRAKTSVLDLGTGCGIIPLILAHRHPKLRIYGIEIQQSLAEIAEMNVKENHLEDRILIRCTDMKYLRQDMLGESVDVVISNPPYRRVCSGRMNPDSQKAVARHEIKATLSDVTETAKRMLRISGRLIVIYPAERAADLLLQMRASQIEPKYFRAIHSLPNSDAKIVLVEGVRGACPGIRIAAPFVIYQNNGSYSPESEAIFSSNLSEISG